MSMAIILGQASLEQFIGLYNYWIVILLMMTGFYIVIARENLIKTIIGLNIFQTSVFLLYITMGKVHGGTAPILKGEVESGDHHDAHAVENGSHASVQTFTGGVDSEVTDASTNQVLDQLLDSAASAASAEVGGGVSPVGFQQEIAHPVQETAAAGSEVIYSNPLPSVLMLTAIVVGIATTALALALVVRIREDYGTIEEDEILEMDRQA